MKMKYLLLFLTLFLCNCVSIPKESADLSAELGKQIGSMQDAHLHLLHQFFDEKRRAVASFMDEKYLPAFADNLFQKGLVQNICTLDQDKDKLAYIMDIGLELQFHLDSVEQALITPIDDLETYMERQLKADYASLFQINMTITNLLESGAKVESARNRYLEKVGITNDRFNTAVDSIDNIVQRALTVEALMGDGTQYIEELKALIEKLKSEFIQPINK